MKRGRLRELAAEYGVDPEPLEALLRALQAEPDPPTTAADPLNEHLADSLVALPHLPEGLSRVADIGSGAGFPALPLAAALPTASFWLFESQRRHAAVAERLGTGAGLSNFRVVVMRVEEFGERELFDLVTARAVAPLGALAEWAAPLLRVGGSAVFWKGSVDEEERLAGAVAAAVVGLVLDRVVRVTPFPGAHSRHLHVYVKASATPDRFPRRPGMARKRPPS